MAARLAGLAAPAAAADIRQSRADLIAYLSRATR
jgi:hypothetical protein